MLRANPDRDETKGRRETHLGSLSLGEGDGGLRSLTDDEDVGETGGEGLSEDVYGAESEKKRGRDERRNANGGGGEKEERQRKW